MRFFGTQTTIGKAYAEHEFIDEAIHRNMPIAVARQSSIFIEEGFRLCYKDSMSNGKSGVFT